MMNFTLIIYKIMYCNIVEVVPNTNVFLNGKQSRFVLGQHKHKLRLSPGYIIVLFANPVFVNERSSVDPIHHPMMVHGHGERVS